MLLNKRNAGGSIYEYCYFILPPLKAEYISNSSYVALKFACKTDRGWVSAILALQSVQVLSSATV